MTQLEIRCHLINRLFSKLMAESSRTEKEYIVKDFIDRYPKIKEDLDYCFEVLAGKHKLGYTYVVNASINCYCTNEPKTIKDFIEKVLKRFSSSQDDITLASLSTPPICRPFIAALVNREFKLGYSNKHNMIKLYSPMLAKKYPESHHEQYYYIQEKLDGNRCIAYFNFDTDEWEFWSRSGKRLNISFDMSWAREADIFDGEIMTFSHAGSRDFNSTSGAINGKYTDKSQLHYYIYDIIDEELTYEERKDILDGYQEVGTSDDCTILKVLDKIWVWPNPDYNWQLDEWLDKIVAKGGEGLILRDPNGFYQCGKRSEGLLKYKKTQTMDLRIIGWNEGKGKYEGMIGSFVCETDDHSIVVNVAGITDEIREADPELFMNKIVEVAYFSISQSKNNKAKSLRFPRLKQFRNDKNETSIY